MNRSSKLPIDRSRPSIFSLRDLRTFIAVVENGGVKQAAGALGYSQPTVTAHVQSLEKQLKISVFQRGRHRLRLSEQGQAVLEEAHRLFGHVAIFQTRLEKFRTQVEPAYSLTIASIEPAATVTLPAILARLCKRFRAVNVRVTVLGGDQIAEAARLGLIDAALTVATQIDGWVYEPLFREPLVALLHENHHLGRNTSVSLSRLAGEPFLVSDESCAYRRALERAMSRKSLRLKVGMQIDSISALPAAVTAGLGVAIIPRRLIIDAPKGTKILRIRDTITFDVGILRPRFVPEGSVLHQFVDECYDLRRHQARTK
jgi:DNA-binding transcriptional LysR family regulator